MVSEEQQAGVQVRENTTFLSGEPAFYLQAESPPDHRAAGGNSADHPPVLYLHGAPTSSDDWRPLLERTGGIAPDLLGFGRSAKGGHLAYTPESLADFLADLLSILEVQRVRMVVHGWGAAAGLRLAAEHPELVERLIIFNAVPLLDGLRWPWWARTFRMPVLGEFQMGFISKTVLARWLRKGSTNPDIWGPRPSLWRSWVRVLRRRPASATRAAAVWEQFDQGTQRAVLRLLRSIDDERLEAMASALAAIAAPTLIVWGARDPWWDDEVLEAYATRMPDAEVHRRPDGGHWPWLDDPAVAELVIRFLDQRDPANAD